MKLLDFYKYQGTGNDFILIDQRDHQWLTTKDNDIIRHLCDRRFGIGADGLILLELFPEADFRMVYFNADGYEGSLCGNGGRCVVAFAHYLGIIEQDCQFMAVDGLHDARIKDGNWVELKMSSVNDVEINEDFYFLDTGSPHYVTFLEELNQLDVVEEGRKIRYNNRFKEVGTNVNFVIEKPGGLEIATYERGVENETLSCGTGVTAAAIAHSQRKGGQGQQEIALETKGGNLKVLLEKNGQAFENIWLCGPAKQVFKGQIPI